MGSGSPESLKITLSHFFLENGLTRWQLYHATSEDAPPPEGYEWSKGPSEPWYRRAAMTPGRLVVHAPAYPVQHMRNTVATPKPVRQFLCTTSFCPRFYSHGNIT